MDYFDSPNRRKIIPNQTSSNLDQKKSKIRSLDSRITRKKRNETLEDFHEIGNPITGFFIVFFNKGK